MANARFFGAYYIVNSLLLLGYGVAKLFHRKHGATAFSMLNEKSFASWVRPGARQGAPGASASQMMHAEPCCLAAAGAAVPLLALRHGAP